MECAHDAALGIETPRVESGTFSNGQRPLLVCLSHLRWQFVYQRPQHLMTRFADAFDTLFIEEPVSSRISEPVLAMHRDASGILVAVPHLPHGISECQRDQALEYLVEGAVQSKQAAQCVLWYYTPMALQFTRHLAACLCVYDCMDELSAFKDAPSNLGLLEQELLGRADLVFTGGLSLYEAKRQRHPSVHSFPSAVDVRHFASAHRFVVDPADQKDIPRPRLGFFGVIDERLDLDLLLEIARARPAWQLVMLGPVAKIDDGQLPRMPNIHYLGLKSYDLLPSYLAGWDVALLPFAQNDSTRFVSPTKTPEYLAAGKRVVSTPIRDVIRAYGEQGLVDIAGTSDKFIAAIEDALASPNPSGWHEKVDSLLATVSWDQTQQRMLALMQPFLDPPAVHAPDRTHPIHTVFSASEVSCSTG